MIIFVRKLLRGICKFVMFVVRVGFLNVVGGVVAGGG